MKRLPNLSTPPRTSERKRAPLAEATREPLIKRLPGMSDYQLSAYQASAHRISRDPAHPKYASALKAIPQIEAEIRRRADALRPAAVKDSET